MSDQPRRGPHSPHSPHSPSSAGDPRCPRRASGLLPVGGGHEIFWEESGNPGGVPAVYLHGGPGSGLGRGGYAQRFDAATTRIVGLDQRGCGRSTPSAATPGYDLAQNTTDHLIADLEALRVHLGIEAWHVHGVSWGSTLALAYACAHPRRVLGIVCMAVTTTRRWEVDWITETAGAMFPEAWDRLATFAETHDPSYRRGEGRVVESYLRLATSTDRELAHAAARAWWDWEEHHVAIGAGGEVRPLCWATDEDRLAATRLVTHYWSHDGFLAPPLLERVRAGALDGIPGVLIHGRLDVSGPAATAWDLHRAWPGSRLEVVESEGHGGPRMVAAWGAAAAHLTRSAARM